MTADSALAELRRGNERFVAGRSFDRDYAAQVALTSRGQFPFAAVVSCLDSRAAPEILFDQGIGDLFVGRVAGNIINDDLLGSLEFATKVAGAKVIVVLGHTECGAVKGACDGVELGKLTTLLDKIEPAIAAVPDDGTPRNSKNKTFVERVTELNVKQGVDAILQGSPVIAELVSQGKVKVVGATYDIGNGQVRWH
jgi:carbonic anhydrase